MSEDPLLTSQVLANPLDQETVAIEAMDEVSGIVCQSTVIERTYGERMLSGRRSSKPHDILDLEHMFEQHLVRLYSQIIDFQARVTRQYSRAKGSRYIRDIFKAEDWSRHLDSMRNTYTVCKSVIEMLARDAYQREMRSLSENLQEVHVDASNQLATGLNTLQEVQPMRAHDAHAQQDQDERDCIRALFKTDYSSHLLLNPPRVPCTCRWLTEHPHYQSWTQSPSTDLLWVSADPGFGKSMLARCLIKEGLDHTPLADCNRAFFFFQDDNEEQKSCVNAICSLLHQLFTRQPWLTKHAINDFRAKGAAFANSMETLWKILLAACSDTELSDGWVIVLDALDECENVSCKKGFLKRLREVGSGEQKQQHGPMRLKILVTSRPYHDIERGFRPVTYTITTIRLAGELESDTIAKEVDAGISHRVQELAINLELTTHVARRLSDRLRAVDHRT